MADMMSGEQLRQAGFSDTEISAYAAEQAPRLKNAGFTQQEINQHFTLSPTENPTAQTVKEQAKVVQGDLGRDDFKLEAAEPKSVFSRVFDKLAFGLENVGLKKTKEQLAGRSAVSLTLAEETGQPANLFEPLTASKALNTGFASSTTGLAYKGPAALEQMLPDEMYKHLDITDRLLMGAAQLAGDLPTFIAGGVIGSAGAVAGGQVGPQVVLPEEIATVPALAMAGAFGLTEGVRKTLIDKYQNGEVKSAKDFMQRLNAAVFETAKGMTVGLVTRGAERAATAIAPKLAPKLPPAIMSTPAEITAMVTTSAALEQELPEPQDFVDAALLIGGMKTVSAIKPKFQRTYEKTNINPGRVLEAAEKDVTIKQDIMSKNREVPAALETVDTRQKIIAAKRSVEKTAEKFKEEPKPEPVHQAQNMTAKLAEKAELAELPKPEIIKPSKKPPADSKSAVLEQISIGEKTKKKKWSWSKLYTNFIDELHPIQRLVKNLSDKKKVATDSNPYELARLYRGWMGKAEHFLEYAPIDFKTGKNIGVSLRSILEPLRNDLNGLRAYSASKRAIELSERGIKSGIDITAAKDVVAKGVKYEKAFEELKIYQDHTLKYLNEAGILSEKAIAKMKEKNKDYIPFYRLVEKDLKGVSNDLKAKQPVKKIKGSKRVIHDPLESIIKNTYTYVQLAEKNRIGEALVKLSEVQGKTDIVKPISEKRVPVKITSEELSKLAKELDINLPKEALTVFRPSAFAPAENVISVWRNGKRKYFEVDNEISRIFNGLDNESLPTLLRVLSKPAKWLRAGAILSPEFIARNPIRDQFSAGIYSKYGFVPGWNLIRGTASMIKKDKYYQEWLKSGGLNSMLTSMDRVFLQKQIKDVTQPKNVFKNPVEVLQSAAWNTVRHPIETLRIFTELSEVGTRLGEFKQARKKGATIAEAGFASREITLDFARIGAQTRALNQIIAFFNAQVQGIDKMARSFKERPIQTTLKTAAYITLPSVILAAVNHDKEWYKETPQWQKDLFWLFKPGDTIWRIPKPFEIGVMFGSGPERFVNWIMNEKDPKAFEGFIKTVGTGLIPGTVPTAALPLIETWANKSFFLDRPIVPASREKLLPEYQYRPYTTELIKAMGKMLGSIPALEESPYIAPAKIENLVRGWTGGLGAHILNIANYSLQQAGVLPAKVDPTPVLADMPVIKAFVVRHPSASAESIQKFYKKYNKFAAVTATRKVLVEKEFNVEEGLKLVQREAKQVDLSAYKDALSQSHKTISFIHENPNISREEKRQLIDKLYYNMIKIAQAGNKLIEAAER